MSDDVEEELTTITRLSRVDTLELKKSHASLIVLKGAEIGRDFRLRKSGMIIGRSTRADISVPDQGASREHARIDFIGDVKNPDIAYAITDLNSTNHTYVNSNQVKTVTLQDGDKVQINNTIFKFVVLDNIEASFHAEIRDRIHYDQLTGLLTKESLYLAYERELQRCLRYKLPMATLMMDLDFFKKVNDGHGHLMGSHVLSEVGLLIRQSIRDSDVSARYGGEEFLSYLTETDIDGAKIAAERIRTAIEAYPFSFDGVEIRVTISIGIAIAPEHGRDLKALVGASDKALYQAKQTGRNRVCVVE